MQTDLDNDARLLARLAKKLADEAKAPREQANNLLAAALGVSWNRLKNWRCYRGVPVAYRYRVAALAQSLGIAVGAAWIDRAIETGDGNGRTGKGQKAAPQQKQKGERRGKQRRAVPSRRHTGRSAAASP